MEIGITNIIDLMRIHFKEKYQEIKEKYPDGSIDSKTNVNLELLNYINSIKGNNIDNYRIIIGLMAVDFYKEIKYKKFNNIEISEMKQATFEMYDNFYDVDDLIQFMEEHNSAMIYLLASFIAFKNLDIKKKKEVFDCLTKEEIKDLKEKFGDKFLLDMKFVEYIANSKGRGTI